MLERAFQNQIRSECAKSSRCTPIADFLQRICGNSENSYAALQLRVLAASHVVAFRAAGGKKYTQ
jgi:hypothetical protein